MEGERRNEKGKKRVEKKVKGRKGMRRSPSFQIFWLRPRCCLPRYSRSCTSISADTRQIAEYLQWSYGDRADSTNYRQSATLTAGQERHNFVAYTTVLHGCVNLLNV